jgi:hypothetical protein
MTGAVIRSREDAEPWEYAFYLDIIGREDDAKVAQALSSLRALSEMVKVLGCYPTRGRSEPSELTALRGNSSSKIPSIGTRRK